MNVKSPNYIRGEIQRSIEKVGVQFDEKKKGVVVGWFNRYLHNDELRYLVWGFLCTPDGELMRPFHAADLSTGDWLGLYDWLGLRMVDGIWLPQRFFITELEFVKERACWAWEVTQKRPITIEFLARLPSQKEEEGLEQELRFIEGRGEELEEEEIGLSKIDFSYEGDIPL